jgi:hypothetical protein
MRQKTKSKPGIPNKEKIRARIGTKMRIEKGQLILQCEGSDPGPAFDRLPSMSNNPKGRVPRAMPVGIYDLIL